LKLKVYGGLHHGRVLVLPEGTRENDIVILPVTLPAGEMHSAGRTHPELHTESRAYKVTESSRALGAEKYLASTALRLVKTVDVPPPTTIPITIHL
jgi:hypothetical protein